MRILSKEKKNHCVELERRACINSHGFRSNLLKLLICAACLGRNLDLQDQDLIPSSAPAMEFIAAPPVHRVLCADCGEYLVARKKALDLKLILQVPLSSPIPPIYALHAFGIRE